MSIVLRIQVSMDRRDFLKTLLGGTCATALAGCRTASELVGAVTTRRKPPPSLRPTVAIKRFGDERDAAAAVKVALDMVGGIDRVVKRGDVVVVKPNLAIAIGGRWVGRVTNSKIVDGVLQAIVDCGGTPIVAEGTCEGSFGTTTGFAKEMGMLDVCRRYGAKFVDLNEDEVVPVDVPRPLIWTQVHLARQVLECDKFVSVPVMKVHRAAGVTLGMKNLIGAMSPKHYGSASSYVRNKMHYTERKLWNQRYGGDMVGENEISYWMPLACTIADLTSARPIDLVVVDGTFGEERNAPSGEFVDIKKRSGSYLVLAGTDAVAVDSIGAHIMRQAPERLQKLRFAAAKGLGDCRVDRVNVVGERLEDVAVPLRGYLFAPTA